MSTASPDHHTLGHGLQSLCAATAKVTSYKTNHLAHQAQNMGPPQKVCKPHTLDSTTDFQEILGTKEKVSYTIGNIINKTPNEDSKSVLSSVVTAIPMWLLST